MTIFNVDTANVVVACSPVSSTHNGALEYVIDYAEIIPRNYPSSISSIRNNSSITQLDTAKKRGIKNTSTLITTGAVGKKQPRAIRNGLITSLSSVKKYALVRRSGAVTLVANARKITKSIKQASITQVASFKKIPKHIASAAASVVTATLNKKKALSIRSAAIQPHPIPVKKVFKALAAPSFLLGTIRKQLRTTRSAIVSRLASAQKKVSIFRAGAVVSLHAARGNITAGLTRLLSINRLVTLKKRLYIIRKAAVTLLVSFLERLTSLWSIVSRLWIRTHNDQKQIIAYPVPLNDTNATMINSAANGVALMIKSGSDKGAMSNTG